MGWGWERGSSWEVDLMESDHLQVQYKYYVKIAVFQFDFFVDKIYLTFMWNFSEFSSEGGDMRGRGGLRATFYRKRTAAGVT